MNYLVKTFERKVYNAETNEVEVKGTKTFMFRLTSKCACDLEKSTNKNIQELFEEVSIKNIVTFIKFMLRWNDPSFDEDKAYEVYDMLVDNDYTLESIITEIIVPTMVVSGFFPKTALEQITENMKVQKKKQ